MGSSENAGSPHDPAVVFQDDGTAQAPQCVRKKLEQWEYSDEKFADATRSLESQRERQRVEELVVAKVAWRKIDVDKSAAAELDHQPAGGPSSLLIDQATDATPPPATPPRPDAVATRKMADAHVQLGRMRSASGAKDGEVGQRAAVL
jgi:hypothetical protein